MECCKNSIGASRQTEEGHVQETSELKHVKVRIFTNSLDSLFRRYAFSLSSPGLLLVRCVSPTRASKNLFHQNTLVNINPQSEIRN